MILRSPNSAVLSLGHRRRKTGLLAGLPEAGGVDVSWRGPAQPCFTIPSWLPQQRHIEFGSGFLAATVPEYEPTMIGTCGRHGHPHPIVPTRPRRTGGGMLGSDRRGRTGVIASSGGSVTVRRKRERSPGVPRMPGLGYFLLGTAAAIQRSARLDLGN